MLSLNSQVTIESINDLNLPDCFIQGGWQFNILHLLRKKTMERLHKILAQAGLGSRRKCETLISSGHISVDGKRVTKMGQLVDPIKNKILCDGVPLKKQKKIYYLLNKPKGYVCTNAKTSEHFRTIDLLKHIEQRIYTVGRLDKDSEGLIILTNDGELANLLSHPRYGIEKTYRVEVRGRITNDAIRSLKRGIWISAGKASPTSIKVIRRRHTSSTLEIILREGKNREIRRILAKVRHPVISLKRIKIGHLTDDHTLKIGRYRHLRKTEIERLSSLTISC
jgi:23S rRNA pseudouridine2605 synthase